MSKTNPPQDEPRLARMQRLNSRTWRRLLVPAALALIAGGVLAYRPRPGISVTVKNVGTNPLENVVVHAAGVANAVGEIAAKQSRTAEVRPNGDAPLEIELTGKDGKPLRLRVGAALDPHRKGTITVAIKDDTIVEIDRGVSFQK